ncbi:TAF7-like RNA polymerase II TAF7L [Besnoitia besnoiti]|uniref:TAF7-like RNA polymerase II TAF7L n=1 Tax=Besnoitia besnoiti TaxID=94643 RepID=A0A2A9MEW2_BESBE|nr:TAF7-like RNA polymerase II TAF7L [Besnoitia besnoiti]PFH33910.1 TAF7-like RNA polymerase II TAF7L [Besnoitia besnoiti]
MNYYPPPPSAEGGAPPSETGTVDALGGYYVSQEAAGIAHSSQNAYLFPQQTAVMNPRGAPLGVLDAQQMAFSQSYMSGAAATQQMMHAEGYMHWEGGAAPHMMQGDPSLQMQAGMAASLGHAPAVFGTSAGLPLSAGLVGQPQPQLGPGESASVVSRASRPGLAGWRRNLGIEGRAKADGRQSSLAAAAQQLQQQQQASRELARRQQTALRRGLFSATELEDWMGEDCPGLDRQCVIRFPPAIAALLRNRLSTLTSPQFHNQVTRATGVTGPEGAPQGAYPPGCSATNPLGLVITPGEEWSSRIFDVKVTGHKGKLVGVLVELPTLLETYKSLDGDLLFKSGDICQMIVVFDPQDPQNAIDLQELCERQQWEWKDGLTPPTHRIRSRKFKNLDLFDRQEIRDAELQVLELLHSTRRDNYEIEVHTLHEMHRTLEQHRDAAAGRGAKPTAPGVTSNAEAVIEHVVSCDDDVLAWLDSVGMLHSAAPDPNGSEGGGLSDYSDVLFDYAPPTGGANAAGTILAFAPRGLGAGHRGPRGARGGHAAWQRVAGVGAGVAQPQPGSAMSPDALIFGGDSQVAPQQLLEDDDEAGSAVGLSAGLAASGAAPAAPRLPPMGVPGPDIFTQPPHAPAPVGYHPGREDAGVVASEDDLEARMQRKEERRQRKLMKKEKRRLKKEKKKAKRDKKKLSQPGAEPGGDEANAGLGLGVGVQRGRDGAAGQAGGDEGGEKGASSSSSSSDEDEGGGRDDDDALML